MGKVRERFLGNGWRGWFGGGLGVVWGWFGGGLGVVWGWFGGGLGVVLGVFS